jgi:3-phosphoshikimate 1-carboxyvinyltransferase
MTDQIEIQPCGQLRARIRPPGSKSITNRALICAALANGNSTLYGTLDSEDTQVMIAALEQLGIKVTREGVSKLLVRGCNGRLANNNGTNFDLFVANSGTTIRFLTAMLSTLHGQFRLDGVTRMRQRPIADLLDALTQLGGSVQSELGTGAPPVLINAAGLAGGTTRVNGDVSSQFLSGLMMAAPNAGAPVTCEINGELVSRPYVEMTRLVMRAFGVDLTVSGNLADASKDGQLSITIPAPQSYAPLNYAIEPDASAASYFWAAAAICGGSVVVKDLTYRSIQGDVKFCECLEQMGCSVRDMENGLMVERDPATRLIGIDVDMNGISDTVQTLAAVAVFAEQPTRIRGVGHIRHKETDRIGDLAKELRKLGALVEEHDDGLTITPAPLQGAQIDTYNDHRMAMSLALVGLQVPGVVIRDPDCVQKTYPAFFSDLARVTS